MGLIERVLGRFFPPQPEPLAEARRGRRVIVRGRVVPRDPIDSPLTGERCVYYRYLVEELRRPIVGLGGDLWVVVEYDEAITEFYVQDDSGRAIVAPQRATVDLPGAVRRVAMPAGRRAVEARLMAGDLVEVEGVVEEIADLLDGDRGYREPPARLLLGAVDGGVIRIRRVDDTG